MQNKWHEHTALYNPDRTCEELSFSVHDNSLYVSTTHDFSSALYFLLMSRDRLQFGDFSPAKAELHRAFGKAAQEKSSAVRNAVYKSFEHAQDLGKRQPEPEETEIAYAAEAVKQGVITRPVADAMLIIRAAERTYQLASLIGNLEMVESRLRRYLSATRLRLDYRQPHDFSNKPFETMPTPQDPLPLQTAQATWLTAAGYHDRKIDELVSSNRGSSNIYVRYGRWPKMAPDAITRGLIGAHAAHLEEAANLLQAEGYDLAAQQVREVATVRLKPVPWTPQEIGPARLAALMRETYEETIRQHNLADSGEGGELDISPSYIAFWDKLEGVLKSFDAHLTTKSPTVAPRTPSVL